MCKYCKHLQEVRNQERKSYEHIIAHLKKELRQDDKFFKEIYGYLSDALDFLPVVWFHNDYWLNDEFRYKRNFTRREQENVIDAIWTVLYDINAKLGKEGDK